MNRLAYSGNVDVLRQHEPFPDSSLNRCLPRPAVQWQQGNTARPSGNGTGLAAVALLVAGCGGAAAAHHAAKVPANSACSAACGGGPAGTAAVRAACLAGTGGTVEFTRVACPASRRSARRPRAPWQQPLPEWAAAAGGTAAAGTAGISLPPWCK